MLQSSAAGLSVTASPPPTLRPRGRGHYTTNRAATAEPVVSKRATAGFKSRGRGRSNVLRTQQPSETEGLCSVQPVGLGRGCAMVEGTLWEADLAKKERAEKERKDEDRLEKERRVEREQKVENERMVEEEKEKEKALADQKMKEERKRKKMLRQVLSIYIWLAACLPGWPWCLLPDRSCHKYAVVSERKFYLAVFALFIETIYQIPHAATSTAPSACLQPCVGHEVVMATLYKAT